MNETGGEAPPGAQQPQLERPPRRQSDVRDQIAWDPRVTVGDGFKFGCGFLLAAGIALLVGALALSAGFLIASLLGVPFPVGAGS